MNNNSRHLDGLKLNYNFMGSTNTLTLVILYNDNGTFILVDTGYPDSLSMIEEQLQEYGKNFMDCTGIVITHHDYDHVGSAAEIVQKYPHIEVYASKEEAPYIEGKLSSLRLEQAKALYPSIPEEQKPFAKRMEKAFADVRKVKVTYPLSNGEKFPWAGGTEIIATPGHMPGHISLYLKSQKTLISGDALVLEDGALNIANPELTLDIAGAVQSLKVLKELPIETVICTHGGLFSGDVSAELSNLIDKFEK